MAVGRPPPAWLVALKEYFKDEDPEEIFLRYAHSLAKDVLLPLAVTLAVLAGSIHLLRKMVRYLFPHPDPIRHKEAKVAYRDGLIQEALSEWKLMEHRYRPAPLSLAANELYVQENPKAALLILDTAKSKFKQDEDKDSQWMKSLEGMQLDAHAMLQGNRVMVQINASIAKGDYLGIYT